MNPFGYVQAGNDVSALSYKVQQAGSLFLAGGTCIVDLLTQGALRPPFLIDINALPLRAITLQDDNSLIIGALASNSAVAHHPSVLSGYPVLSESILAGASAQIRNAASIGGNLLQKTRCYYYRDPSFACNKRTPGSGCPAITGANRMHAIFGTSEQCIAVHPSDMAVGLSALDAAIHTESSRGKRQIAIDDFFLLPGDTPDRETILEQDELITAVEIPATPFARKSNYLKVRDRSSYAFALVSVAGAVVFEGNSVKEIRLSAGGVAHKPWRLQEAEQTLLGRPLEEGVIARAMESAVAGAKTYRQNAVKVDLLKRCVRLMLHRFREMA
ncbi:MAG: xanthine dehydrogenase family protein subunit M [Acidobacteriaceae bacterium]|nr:xanthine dehydrogenase family protein subunit M [Acidobacteriaceae bacterium]MBV9308717.1 xanthine dehydrogenase family protein subunit M [Acidobacteriaceae bacterium]